MFRSAGEGLMKLLAEPFKRAEHNSLPNPPHRVKVKEEVVDRVERRTGHFARHIEVAEVGTAVPPAGIAATLGIRWTRVLGVTSVLDDNHALAGQELAVPGVAGGQDTVEQ